MKIDLTQTKIFCLTCEPEDGKKRRHIQHIIPRAEFVEPIIGIPKNKSGATGFMRMVERGLKIQTPGQPFKPFLMLEDDVALNKPLNELEIPDDTDILYVGISNCSMNDHRFHYANYYESVAEYPGIVRIKHMLSTHGIMICSPLGAAVVQRTMLEVYLSDKPWDIPLALIQPYYRVYALRYPLVYQDANYNGDEGCTKIRFDGSDSILPTEWVTRDLSSIRML
jgi:hypothetical protein